MAASKLNRLRTAAMPSPIGSTFFTAKLFAHATRRFMRSRWTGLDSRNVTIGHIHAEPYCTSTHRRPSQSLKAWVPKMSWLVLLRERLRSSLKYLTLGSGSFRACTFVSSFTLNAPLRPSTPAPSCKFSENISKKFPSASFAACVPGPPASFDFSSTISASLARISASFALRALRRS